MRAVKIVSPLLPETALMKIPVVGVVKLPLPGGATVRFYSDGYDYTASSLYWHGLQGYEKSTLEIFLRILPWTRAFMDIGANTGIYSLIAAVDNPQRRVYAFEPVPRIFEALKKNVEINGILNLEAHRAAITNRDGEITLYVPPGRIPAGATTNPKFPTLKSALEKISVPAVKLDTFIENRNLSGVDLIKIDTETTEPEVLEGAANIIKRDRPFIICEVLEGRTEDRLSAIFSSIGYKYFWLSSSGMIEKKEIIGCEGDKNYLFAPREKLERICT